MEENKDVQNLEGTIKQKLMRYFSSVAHNELQASMVNAAVSFLKQFPEEERTGKQQGQLSERMESLSKVMPFPK